MKTRITSMLAFVVTAIFFSSCTVYARSYDYDRYDNSNRYSNRNVTVEAENSDISYNLDLRAVANVFADSRNLEEFERRINDYDTGINNLDLNNDGQVDYLRVIETKKGNTHLVVLQAVIGYDLFQDVASIVVERRNSNRNYVQIIGDPYIYGPYYIIEPIYVYTPPIFSWFWGPRYYRWYSPYYWGYYPSYWSYWRPYPTYHYCNNINIYIDNSRHSYRYSDRITNNYYNEMRQEVSRNDYQRANPNRSFSSRNADRSNVSNRRDLGELRSNNRSNGSRLSSNPVAATRDSRNTANRVTDNSRSRSANVNSRTATQSRNADVNSRTNTATRSSGVNSRTATPSRSTSATTSRGAVRSADQWNNVRSRNSSGTQSSVNSRSQSTTSRNSDARSSSSRSSTVTPNSSSRSSSTYGTTNRSSSSTRSSGTYSTPSRSSSSSSTRSSGTYSTPSRSSSSSSTPSRSSSSGTYSAPSRSSNSRSSTYSAPSRSSSSGTYSAPSRSSSSRSSGTYSAPSRSSSAGSMGGSGGRSSSSSGSSRR